MVLLKEKHMLELHHGNVLSDDTEAIVNTVNCEGFMGKGIALQFKKAYPDNYKVYHNACNRKEVRIGKMLVYETGSTFNPKYIINFPTKNKWKENSRIEYIKEGLLDLKRVISKLNIDSIAVPPLGCGLGGLKWDEVKPLIIQELTEIKKLDVHLYPPEGAPSAANMLIGTLRPALTKARAMLLSLMKQYKELSYSMSLIEIQKMAYFLQESGENLRLQFVKEKYGPYAHNLNKVLELLEGHYITGYGDTQKRNVEIQLLEYNAEEIEDFLKGEPHSIEHLKRVSELIMGFETPYSMELLATVHWVATKEIPSSSDLQICIDRIQKWNPRKKDIFLPQHIEIAWQRLKEQGWMN